MSAPEIPTIQMVANVDSSRVTPKKKKRPMLRKVEYVIGKKMLTLVNEMAVKQAKLQEKSVFLPKAGITMHYLERDDSEVASATTTSTDDTDTNPSEMKTLLFLHGLADEGKNFAPFITSLMDPKKRKDDEAPHGDDDNVTKQAYARIIIPDLIGHGRDLQRYLDDVSMKAKEESQLELPTPNVLLNAMIEFLEIVLSKRCGHADVATTPTQCNAFGYSIGGALLYYLRYKRPDLINKTCLIAPSLQFVIGDEFVKDFQNGKKNHFCFETRHDAKTLFRDLSVPHRQKQNPLPMFLMQAIYKLQVQSCPKNHFRKILTILLESRERGIAKRLLKTNTTTITTSSSSTSSAADDDVDNIVVMKDFKEREDLPSDEFSYHEKNKVDINSESGKQNVEHDNSAGKVAPEDENEDDDESLYHIESDIDPTSPRLVVWPTHDYICDHTKGKQFFAFENVRYFSSRSDTDGQHPFASGTQGNTEFVSVNDCGHMFHSDGTFVLDFENLQSKMRAFLFSLA